MIEIDDQTLMAFADGELDVNDAAEVREALEHDATLQARLEKLHDMDGLLRAAIAPGSDVPNRFAQLLRPTASVLPFRRAWVPVGAALAAGLAVWMGGITLTGQTAWLHQTDHGIAIAGPVAEAASNAPSGTLLKDGNLVVRPVVSFTATDSRPCRDLNLRDGNRSVRVIACHDGGGWMVEAMANVPVSQDGETYRPAGAAKSPVIDAALTQLGAAEPMSESEETAAISRNWSTK